MLDQMSDSESIEDSLIEESFEFDEEALKKEEQTKLAQIFEKVEQRNSSISGSKVKLPYEMLINKLVDSLDTPQIIKQR